MSHETIERFGSLALVLIGIASVRFFGWLSLIPLVLVLLIGLLWGLSAEYERQAGRK